MPFEVPEVVQPTRHSVLITPYKTRWIMWCRCGSDADYESFEAAVKGRASHLGLTSV